MWSGSPIEQHAGPFSTILLPFHLFKAELNHPFSFPFRLNLPYLNLMIGFNDLKWKCKS